MASALNGFRVLPTSLSSSSSSSSIASVERLAATAAATRNLSFAVQEALPDFFLPLSSVVFASQVDVVLTAYVCVCVCVCVPLCLPRSLTRTNFHYYYNYRYHGLVAADDMECAEYVHVYVYV